MTSSSKIMCTRKEIFDILKGHLQSELNEQITMLEKSVSGMKKINFKVHLDEKNRLKALFSKLKTKWQQSGRVTSRFFKVNESWLKTSETIAVSFHFYFFSSKSFLEFNLCIYKFSLHIS